jgi:serine/threonine-protein kinase
VAEQPDLAKTVVNTGLPGSPAPAVTAVPVDTRRPTVLPRVEWVGEKPSLSLSSRERFEEIKPLGVGGMGEVVLAKDHDIDRSVAVKRLPPQADVALVLRFVEEIRTVGQLEHPNIVPVHDVGIDSMGRYYFVMKHLHGETLESVIARLRQGEPAAHQRFSFAVRLQIFLGVLNAVGYAHEQGFIHRDLKPANIMIGPFGEVTVMDWGLAKRVRGAATPELPPIASPVTDLDAATGVREAAMFKTQAGEVMGTPFYMSPEQSCGEPLDERSDTYSLGVILHELLYLKHYLEAQPTVTATLEAVQTVTPPLLAVPPRPPQAAVPAELGWYLKKAMAKEPDERFQSVAQMKEALQRLLAGEVAVRCPQTLAKYLLHRFDRFVDAHPLALVVGGSTAIALFLGAMVCAVLFLVR